MKHLKYLAPAIILTGCSMGSHSFDHHAKNGAYGQQGQSGAYAQPCDYTGCESSYSVNSAQASNSYGHTNHGSAHHAQAYGAAQQPSAHAYGSQVAHHGAPHGAQGAYGQPPQLRGAYGQPKRGYTYGTLGAAMYDTDADIFGAQGRLGYQSAGIWGAEIEGFTGLTKEKETLGADSAELGVDYMVGAFGVLRQQIAPKWSLHTRAGYQFSGLSGEETIAGVTSDVDVDGQDGFAYGVGAEYALSNRDFVRADFTRYDQDLGTNESVSIAYGRKF